MKRGLFLMVVVLVACKVSPVQADGKNPNFNDDIVPVLRQHCMNCHGNDKQRGGLNVATYTAMMAGGSSGNVLTAGDPNKSRLFTLTAHTEEPKMPPNAAKIPQPQIDLMKLWIEQGAKENSMSKVSIPLKPKVDIGLKNVGKGKPEGPPPMPIPGKLKLEPIVKARRPNAVLALAASPWAPLLAVGGQKQVILYHADTGDLLGVLPFEHGQINSLKFSRNAKLLLAAGGRGGATGKAVLFNVETGEKVTEVGSAETDAILSADISPDQTLIAVGTPTKMIRLYNTADGSVANSIKKHTDWVTSVEFSPDGVLLATGDRNGGLFVWEANTAREFHTLRGHTAMITDLSWRADSNLLASSSEDTTVRLWEMENGGQVRSWGAHPGGAASVKFSMDGRLVTVGRDRVTKLWDGNGGLQKQFEAFPDLGLRVAISHDNSKVVAGDWSGSLKVWNTVDAKVVAALDTNPSSLADQLKQAEAAVAPIEAKVKQANEVLAAAQLRAKQAGDAYIAAQATAAKVTAELAASTKAITDHTNAINAANGQLPASKVEADKWTGLNTAAQNSLAALSATAPIYAEAAKKIAEAAAKLPANQDLANAAKAAAALAQQHATQLTASQKGAADASAGLKVAAEKYAALMKTVTANQAALAEHQKKVAALQPMVKPTADAVAPAKTAADAATAAVAPLLATANAANAELSAAKAKLDRLKPKLTVAPPK
jgi:hypothetical protein